MESFGGGLAGIYTRISADVNGDALGVQRQEADARKLCASHGWTVVQIFCDNDRSAYNRRKARPAYLAMLDAIKAGEINVIVAWHPDRLHRQTRELVPFIDLINEYGVRVETVTAGRYDLSTPSGRMNARIVGSVAEYESEHKAERVRRKLEANAAEGLNHGGSRPYGWTVDRKALDPAEVVVVRDAAERVLAGESVKAIARVLNGAGHRTATGREWRDVTVRDMLLRPRNAGLRVHHGEVVGHGKWTPILPADVFHQVEAILSNPARRTNPGNDGRVHLLSVLARCAVCDTPVVVAKGKPYKGKSKPIYRCRSAHVIRDQASVDDLVTRIILARLALPDAVDLLAEPDRAEQVHAAAARVQELHDRLNDAAEAYAAGAITLAQLTTINAAVSPKLDQAQTDAASPDRDKVLGGLVRATHPATVWERMTPDRRRAVVDMLVEIRIMPTRKGPRFNPKSVKITWKT
ncbi:recombinase family protein [Mycobacterium fragae]|uniref:Serine recombinase n=1 Tax=Mycobacterium fragae TaxID=1260918 RepID=A0A1X1UIY4_9MYCO|nr:recombinase family protein [Mycobacterium fragae]MCV7401306.1 recombinase family protein [Mycobacterium fragae]ORV56774.1 serine recombinase [Mycobacterium fragae]